MITYIHVLYIHIYYITHMIYKCSIYYIPYMCIYIFLRLQALLKQKFCRVGTGESHCKQFLHITIMHGIIVNHWVGYFKNYC